MSVRESVQRIEERAKRKQDSTVRTEALTLMAQYDSWLRLKSRSKSATYKRIYEDELIRLRIEMKSFCDRELL